MKFLWIFLLLLLPARVIYAQQSTPLPHGMIFGDKPDTANAIEAATLRKFMGHKKRIKTALKGKIIKVTKEKGGWFDLETSSNRSISAHFTNYNVTLPADIAGRTVIIDCIAKKQFLADDHQHFAGDTVTYRRADSVFRHKIVLEVNGLMVYQ